MTFQALCESQLPFFNGGATWLRHTENQPPLSGAATSPPRSGRTPERKGLSSLSAFPVPTRTRDESGRSHLPTAVTTSMLWPLWPKWQRTGSVDIHRNNVQSRFSCAWEGMPVMCVAWEAPLAGAISGVVVEGTDRHARPAVWLSGRACR
jgi:hypothetical protein